MTGCLSDVPLAHSPSARTNSTTPHRGQPYSTCFPRRSVSQRARRRICKWRDVLQSQFVARRVSSTCACLGNVLQQFQPVGMAEAATSAKPAKMLALVRCLTRLPQ